MQSSSLGISLKVKDWRAGVPLPTCPSRFHRTPIHTILDEPLVNFESYYEAPYLCSCP